MCFDHCLPFHRDEKKTQCNAVLSQGIIYLRVRGGSPWGPGTLADQFPGRSLLALGRWIMAVKIDTLETVPAHVAIAAGLGGKAILLINGEFRAETTRCTVFAIGSLVMRCENPPFEA
ncbi:MAG: hypothetical protein WB586_03520, partial [Chthoniobacterales bacterium]